MKLTATKTAGHIFTDAKGVRYTANGWGVRNEAGLWLGFPNDGGTIHAWPVKSTAVIVADTVDATGVHWLPSA